MNTEQGSYDKLPTEAAAVNAGAILGRLVDSLGFRFRWAVEGMTDADMPWKPAADCMTHDELFVHIHDMLVSVARVFGSPEGEPLPASTGCAELTARVLALCANLSARVRSMSDGDLAGCTPKLWNMVNGPLADSLTHVGQILSWRRLAGAPPAPADLFRGLPPGGGRLSPGPRCQE